MGFQNIKLHTVLNQTRCQYNYLSSSNQRLMHHFSYTKLHSLTNTPMDAFQRLSAPSSGSPVLTVKSSDRQNGYKNLSNNLVCQKISQLKRDSIRMAPTSAEMCQNINSQSNLVDEKWCCKRWFDEDK